MNQPLARKNGLIVQELPEEVLVYDTEHDKAHCLNRTAALIWKCCDGKTEAADIATILSRELKAPVKEEFVWLALDQLEKELLLAQETKFSFENRGFSRRELIKRVGLASVVALPIITSLVNPMSAKAAGCSITTGCTTTNASTLCASDINCQLACTSTGACRNVA